VWNTTLLSSAESSLASWRAHGVTRLQGVTCTTGREGNGSLHLLDGRSGTIVRTWVDTLASGTMRAASVQGTSALALTSYVLRHLRSVRRGWRGR
jgi:hypothetical protein